MSAIYVTHATLNEIAWAQSAAHTAIENGKRYKCKDFTIGDHFVNHTLGFLGEIIVSRLLRMPWRGADFDTRLDGDVDNIEVRTKEYPKWKDMILDDRCRPDRIYVLAWIDPADYFVRIAGWCYGHEGMKDEYNAPFISKARKQTWLYPHTKLRPIEDLLRMRGILGQDQKTDHSKRMGIPASATNS